MNALVPSSTLLRRRLLHLLLVAIAAVLAVGLLPAGVAVAAAPAVEQCNGVDNVGGEEVRCEVTVVNSFDVGTGLGSSTVTVQECHGPAGAPICGPVTTTTYADVVLSVRQCEGSGGGGGGVVACTVRITNDITGAATTAPATVNQCNGSGEGGGTMPTTSCSPIGSTTGATVTQCNSAGNGGGASLRVTCTVDPSTQTAALPVSISQCNGSGNGGGATVTCRSSLTSNVTTSPTPSPSASPTPSATPSASPSATPSATPSVTPSATPSATPSGTPTPVPTVTPGTPVATPVPTPVPPVTGTTDTPITALPPVVALPPGDSSQNVPQLPRTGSDLGLLALAGLVLLGVGGLTLLLAARPRYVGRHVRLA